MIIKSVEIKKFRGFSDGYFELGKHITVIAGQNGTQKTTLLGILSQTFTLSDQNLRMSSEKPLSGGNYRSSFAEKFKLSDEFDTPGNHEWTLTTTEVSFTVESIIRDSKSKSIRFWQKGQKGKGSGYLQYPVIYLSLSRLSPIGEDEKLKSATTNVLSQKEMEFYEKWHNKILIIPDVTMTKADYLNSTRKNTIGANTSFYDWKMNSAGQDNIGKILLAIMSFQRLKGTYPNEYQGGILVIDELDATLYPASQVELFDALNKFASDYQLQIIFTTHSLNILEHASKIQEDSKRAKQVNIIYMKKQDQNIIALNNISFRKIKNELNLTMELKPDNNKIPTFTEDDEAKIFLQNILKTKRTPKLRLIRSSLSCNNYISLNSQKVPAFMFPQSLIILDGDVKHDKAQYNKLLKTKHFLILPGDKSPERLLAEFLMSLSDASPVWNKLSNGYSKQKVFQKIMFNDIMDDREKAKKWFNEQKQYWGRNCSKIINYWIRQNQQIVEEFIEQFDKKLEQFSKYYDIIG